MVEAEHMCMTMRGIEKPGSKTITTVAKGLYKEDREERKEILSLMRDFQELRCLLANMRLQVRPVLWES